VIPNRHRDLDAWFVVVSSAAAFPWRVPPPAADTRANRCHANAANAFASHGNTHLARRRTHP
jgi:hypothetical protein